MIVHKIWAKSFPVRHRQAALPEFRGWLNVFRLFPHAPVGLAILLVDLGEFRAGAFRVTPLRDVSAIEKRHVEDGIGEDVLEPVISEIDFVVADQWILLK